VDITLVSKAKHALLWKAAKTLGSQSELAYQLGVPPQVLGQWINLKGTPFSLAWGDEKQDNLDSRFCEIVGATMHECFPGELVEWIKARAKNQSLTFEQTKDINFQRLLSGYEQRMTLPAPNEEAELQEQKHITKNVVSKLLRSLTAREKRAIELRMEGKTLLECGRLMAVSVERARHILESGKRRLIKHADIMINQEKDGRLLSAERELLSEYVERVT